MTNRLYSKQLICHVFSWQEKQIFINKITQFCRYISFLILISSNIGFCKMKINLRSFQGKKRLPNILFCLKILDKNCLSSSRKSLRLHLKKNVCIFDNIYVYLKEMYDLISFNFQSFYANFDFFVTRVELSWVQSL